MVLTRIPLDRLLADHVQSMWVFESQFGMPPNDLRIGVPHGKVKLIIPYKGDLFYRIDGQPTGVISESTVGVVGLMSRPIIIDGLTNLGLIGIEFNLSSASRFFPFLLHGTVNGVQTLADVLGTTGATLQQRIADQPTVAGKLTLLKHFLLSCLQNPVESHWLIDQAIHALNYEQGLISINGLAEKLGYSKRYVDMRFAECVGMPPKTIARIIRFQRVYKRLASGCSYAEAQTDLYDFYYDQSHFINEFKEFTGYPPSTYARRANAFGELFYK